MPREISGPFAPQEIRRFLDTLLYEPEAFLIDAVTRLDQEALRRGEDGHHPATLL